jgi:hypothetical protein
LTEKPSTLHAELWCCGDELDGLCYQPRVWRRVPISGERWPVRQAVWSGTFVNEPDLQEYAAMKRELLDKMAEYGIPNQAPSEFDEPYGSRVDPPDA